MSADVDESLISTGPPVQARHGRHSCPLHPMSLGRGVRVTGHGSVVR